jgi:hypothetical protein
MRFFLGTHEPGWLGRPEFADTPLFVSAIRLRLKPVRGRAVGRWALDSGGFSELSQHGRWTVPAEQYVAEVRRWRDEIGGLEWAAVQDWMCEPQILLRTGYTVAQHQTFTFNSYIRLMALDGSIPWVPVLQGFREDEYLRHADYYEKMLGFPLSRLPLVGLGSICRRQGTREAERIVGRLVRLFGVKLHLFGFKLKGLRRCAGLAASADSMAWSSRARFAWDRDGKRMLPDCTHPKSCSNCPAWALHWKRAKVDPLTRPAATLWG